MEKKNLLVLKTATLVILRVLIGWHFFYEGMAKLSNPYWSSSSYLAEVNWIFPDLFQAIVANPAALKVLDFLNIWGLMAIGAGLIAGCLTSAATVAGIILLLVYYLTNPPFIGVKPSMPAEGSYLIVNKVLIEMSALFVLLLFPTGRIAGLDRFIFGRKKPPRDETEIFDEEERPWVMK